MRVPKFAVIGAPKSGTKYVSELFRAVGINCGHEEWWGKVETRTKTRLDGDSSWMALPEIEFGKWSGTVIHVVRNPVSVVRSLASIGIISSRGNIDPYYREYLLRFEPDLLKFKPVIAESKFWRSWNERCRRVADVSICVERIVDEFGKVEDLLGKRIPKRKLNFVSKKTNSTVGLIEINPGIVRKMVYSEAVNYGYFGGK